MTEPLTRQQALELLRDSDHLIIPGTEARAIAAAFGVEVETYNIQDTRSQVKGATLPGVKEGEVVEDLIDATNLAQQICKGLDLDYPLRAGRGSQLRECVKALGEALQLDTGRDGGFGI